MTRLMIILLAFPLTQSVSVANEVDLVFERDIQPIFRNRCIRCHGPKEREAELSLKSHKEVIRGGESGRILVPGKPENSLIFKMVSERKMPPEGEGRLTQEEIARIRRWIEHGAKFANHSASAGQSINTTCCPFCC